MPSTRSTSSAALLAAVALQVAGASLSAQQLRTLPRQGLSVPSLSSTTSVAVADFDQDGDPDVLFACLGYPLAHQDRLYRNDGRGRFVDVTATGLPPLADVSRMVVVGDLDGDGDLDAVFAHDGGLKVLINDGTGAFADLPQPGVPVTARRAVALGDLDGDGDLDVFTVPFQVVLLNDGAGNFSVSSGQLPPSVGIASDIALADFDGDGSLDIAQSKRATAQGHVGKTSLYLNDGSGNFTDVTATNIPFHSAIFNAIVAGDLDGDGDMDLAVLGQDIAPPYLSYNLMARVRVLLNNGAGSFSVGVGPYVCADDAVAADIDGDGDLDLLVANGGDASSYYHNSVLLNDGSGSFDGAPWGYLPNSAVSACVAAADVDADGDLEMIGRTVYVNVARQLHAPAAPRIGQPCSLSAYMVDGATSALDLAAIWLSTGAVNVPIPGLGTLGIDPLAMVPFPVVNVAPATGIGTVSWGVPNNPGLVGVDVYYQAVFVDPSSGLVLSNVVADTIGP